MMEGRSLESVLVHCFRCERESIIEHIEQWEDDTRRWVLCVGANWEKWI